MAAVIIEVNNPPELQIKGVFTGFSWGIVLSLTEDDDVTPVDFVGDYTFSVYRDPKKKDLVFSKVLDYTTNSMPLGQTTTENKFAATTYYFDIDNDVTADISRVTARGTLIVESGR